MINKIIHVKPAYLRKFVKLLLTSSNIKNIITLALLQEDAVWIWG